MANTFKGGMHIDDHKSNTNKIPIKTVDGGKIHVYPLQQHIGAPLNPVVNIGDLVKVGDLIADNQEAFVCSPIHSSVSGKVVAIEPRVHPSGAKVTSIVIENDELYEVSDSVQPKNPDEMTEKEIINVIRNAGIVGMGGAGFPTHVKLSPPPDKKITHIIVNGAECEPYLTSDHRRMLEIPEQVIDGLKITMKALKLDNGYIGVELNKQDAIDVLNKTIKPSDNIHVIPLKTKYPQGAEKQLIYAVTKRKVPSGGLPADVGVIVINIDTVVQISKAFRTGMPLTERIITMSGDCIKEPANFEVRTGMSFADLIEKCGGFSETPDKLLMGGPMMGMSLYTTEVPVIKTSSSILALKDDCAEEETDQPCLKCGKCVNHCPMNLMPLYLNKYSLKGNLEMAEKYNILDCLECGVCSYICPSRQSLTHAIRIAKQQVIENKRKQQKK